MELLFLLLIPLLTAGFCMINRSTTNLKWTIGTGSVLLFLAGCLILDKVYRSGPIEYYGGLFYADLLSAYFIFVVCLIGALSSLYSIGYMERERHSGELAGGPGIRTYYLLSFTFITTMLLATSTGNMGILWIAIEATTLSSTLLVGFYKKPEAIEAAWKYVIICSVGITFALFGTLLVYYSSVKVLGEASTALNFSTLMAVSAALDPGVLKLAFCFILIGYGTKAGLAPMHAWLPDAHSAAPTPMSALLSGVLLSCAIYGILRFYIIVSHCVGPDFTNTLLLIFGLLSMGIATCVILVQKNIKRLLAYSSLEHMGAIAVGVGIGHPIALYGALFHVLNHAVSKTLAFFVAGNIIQHYGTQEMARIQGVFRALPLTGFGLVVGVLAITGSPPFGIFISEFLIISGGFRNGEILPAILFLAFTVAIFVGFIRHLGNMIFRPVAETIDGPMTPIETPDDDPTPRDSAPVPIIGFQGETRSPILRWQMIAIVLCLVPVVWLGVVIPSGLDDILNQLVLFVR